MFGSEFFNKATRGNETYSQDEIIKSPVSFATKFVVSTSNGYATMVVDRPTEVWINVSEDLVEKIDAQKTFKIKVISPIGNLEPLKCFKDLIREKFVCVFEPLTPGLYYIEVTIHGTHQVKGSPYLMFISRNYLISSPFLRITPICNLVEMVKSNQKFKRKLWGIAYNKRQRRIYVTDRKNNQILVFDGSRKLKYYFGRTGFKTGEFLRPCGIAYDGVNDQILVADKNNNRIQVFDGRGKFLTIFESSNNIVKVNYPWGIAVSVDGTKVAVSEVASRRVFLFNREGELEHLFNFSKDMDNYPKNEALCASGITFDISGKLLYLTDCNRMNLWMIDVERKRTFLLNKDTAFTPQGISIDDSDNIVATDTKNSSIRILSKRGFVKSEVKRSSHFNIRKPINVVALEFGVLAIIELSGKITIY